jgi:nicotinate-nucleotide--dimethylbenzimidazole phosphoribosyltransferase
LELAPRVSAVLRQGVTARPLAPRDLRLPQTVWQVLPQAKAVAPEAVAPEAVAPEAVAPEAVAPEAVEPEYVERR